jgi:2-phosphosulfolactate phosphatase
MDIHIMEGAPGCSFARERGAVAVIVDALRASATAAALLEAGALEILAVREVGEAFAARADWPDALLCGERGGLPPEGFDHGNSPAEAGHAAGRRVIFTTTTGAGRLVEAWGAAAVLMGAPVNTTAAARAALDRAAAEGADIVLVPAGLMDEPGFDAQEDLVAAVVLARRAMEEAQARGLKAHIRAGRGLCEYWLPRIDTDGIEALFQRAPHADNLRGVGRESDIPLCARLDTVTAVPVGHCRHPLVVVLRRA